MNKAVMISIRPQWAEKIANGDKTIEVRRTAPKLETPFKCYIYMTKTKERCRFWEYMTAYQNSKGEILDGSQKVIGEFVCDAIYKIEPHNDGYGVNQYICGWTYNWKHGICDDCLSFEEMHTYLNGQIGYGWHISDLVIYDQPRAISEFARPCDGCDKIGTSRCTEEISPCRATILKRPPQSWQFVQSIMDGRLHFEEV